MISFLGYRDDNGYVTLFPKNYYVGYGHRKAEIDTTLDTAKHMRLIINNEVPEHVHFQADETKDACEPRGMGITSRTIYATPERWIPGGGLCMFSNHRMVLSAQQAADTGVKRRINYYRFQHAFTDKDARDVKLDIEQGKFIKEFWWLTRQFYKYLTQHPTNVSRLLPRPPRIVEETNALLEGSVGDVVRDFIENETEPAVNYTRASDIVSIKEALASYIDAGNVPDINSKAFLEKMEAAGIKGASNGTRRVLVYKYPGERRMKAIKLKESV